MQMNLHSGNIWLSTEPVDFRKSIDGLCAVIVEQFGQHPQDGLYIFFNRHKDKAKLLGWHHNGFVLIYKRLEQGHFYVAKDAQTNVAVIDRKQLGWLLAGLDWASISHWETLSFDEFS